MTIINANANSIDIKNKNFPLRTSDDINFADILNLNFLKANNTRRGDIPIIGNTIYMFDLSNVNNYIGDANSILTYDKETFINSTPERYALDFSNIILFPDFSGQFNPKGDNFSSNSLNMYYTKSPLELGYWYIDTSQNIKYSNSIISQDISTIDFTTNVANIYDVSLSQFFVSPFNDNFAFIDFSNLIISRNNNFYRKSYPLVWPINILEYNMYGTVNSPNFITEGTNAGELVIGTIPSRGGVIEYRRFTLNGSSQWLDNVVLTIPTIFSPSSFGTGTSRLNLMYNISSNGNYLGLFNVQGFLEIYKFNGTKYKPYKVKKDKSYYSTTEITCIYSISNDGSIICLVSMHKITGPSNLEIYRIK